MLSTSPSIAAFSTSFATAPASAPANDAPYLRDLAYVPNADGSANDARLREILLAITGGSGQHCEGVSSAAVSLTPVLGGITNQLFRADFAGADRAPLLVRVFGGEGMIDRDIENATFAGLAAAGVGVPYHGRFGNGRVEGWLDGAEALELSQMGDPDVTVRVAKELAKLHAFELSAEAKHEQPSMWPQLWSWLKQAQSTCEDIEERWGPDVAARFDNIHDRLFTLGQGGGGKPLDRIEFELVELERSLPPSPPVFAHNDALAGNIMLDKATGDVTLIDFEYGGCNYRGFDIANHWNEWAGGTQAEMNGRCEYERFPSPEQQRAFCRSYLEQDSLIKAQSVAVDDAAVQALVDEANSYVLVNHWYWGLWAVNQATTEGIEDFDYLTYAESRAQRYFDTK